MKILLQLIRIHCVHSSNSYCWVIIFTSLSCISPFFNSAKISQSTALSFLWSLNITHFWQHFNLHNICVTSKDSRISGLKLCLNFRLTYKCIVKRLTEEVSNTSCTKTVVQHPPKCEIFNKDLGNIQFITQGHHQIHNIAENLHLNFMFYALHWKVTCPCWIAWNYRCCFNNVSPISGSLLE